MQADLFQEFGKALLQYLPVAFGLLFTAERRGMDANAEAIIAEIKHGCPSKVARDGIALFVERPQAELWLGHVLPRCPQTQLSGCLCFRQNATPTLEYQAKAELGLRITEHRQICQQFSDAPKSAVEKSTQTLIKIGRNWSNQAKTKRADDHKKLFCRELRAAFNLYIIIADTPRRHGYGW